MGNPHRGEVSFEDEGRQMIISFSSNAMCLLEEEFKLSTPEIGQMLSNFRMTDVRRCFWIGLLDKQPQTTFDDAKLILSHQLPAETVSLVSRAYQLAFPNQEGGDVRPPEAAANLNGGGLISSPPGSPPA